MHTVTKQTIIAIYFLLSLCGFNYSSEAAWTEITSNTSESLMAIWGDLNNIFIVGSGGLILHYDGKKLQEMHSPTNVDLRGIWGTTATNIFAVGDESTIIHYDGNSWENMNILSLTQYPVSLNGIWGSSSSDVFAVGGENTILHYDGINWNVMETGVYGYFYAIWGSSSNNAFAVGEDGIIFYNGRKWGLISEEIQTRLTGIWGSSESDVFIGGQNGFLFHFDGTTWSEMQKSSRKWIHHIWGSSPHDVFCVGESGSVVYYDGKLWNTIRCNKEEDLYGIWGRFSNDIYIVGDNGIILHYDGVQDTETNCDMYGDLDCRKFLGIWDVQYNARFHVWRFHKADRYTAYGTEDNNKEIIAAVFPYDNDNIDYEITSPDDPSFACYLNLDPSGTEFIGATGEGLLTVEGKKRYGSVCLVSQILNGKDDQLSKARKYRDELLSKNKIGQSLISFYYNKLNCTSDILERLPCLGKVIAKVFEKGMNLIQWILK